MLRSFYFSFFICSKIIKASQSTTWSYSSQPWDSGMCLKGEKQSPVILQFPGDGVHVLTKYYSKKDTSKDDLKAGKFLKKLNRETFRFKKVPVIKSQPVTFEFSPVIKSGNLVCPKWLVFKKTRIDDSQIRNELKEVKKSTFRLS